MSEIQRRKNSHLDLCASADVEHVASNLLEEVHLLHDSLPEVSAHEVDLSSELFGRRLQAPLIIAGMTGGTERAGVINRALATAAQKCGVGMGLGSQRAMLLDPSARESYRLRDLAPDIPLLANLGLVQAGGTPIGAVEDLIGSIGADALCVHLNCAQELVQDEGDRDFRGGLDALGTLISGLPVPVVVKETGCGMSPRTLARLAALEVAWVDVSGAGGTTWTGVESLRGSARQRALGVELREWGIPTAASLLYARRFDLRVIASGGIRTGQDVARCLALGADCVAMALPFLLSYERGGVAGVVESVQGLLETLRAVAVLTGSRNLSDLRSAPRVIGPHLRAWLGVE